jgi:hypothetical protein
VFAADVRTTSDIIHLQYLYILRICINGTISIHTDRDSNQSYALSNPEIFAVYLFFYLT